MEKKARKELNLSEKFFFIEAYDKGGIDIINLSKEFEIGKTQGYEILKNKDSIKSRYLSTVESVDLKKKSRHLLYPDIDNEVFKWFCHRREQKLPISGPLIREQALRIASVLKVENFKASVGWLNSFRQRHFIKAKVINGESGAVDMRTASEWIENLGHLTSGYSESDIFNMDETGLFFCGLPHKTLCLAQNQCHDGKFSIKRLSIALCSNAAGTEKLKPIVIGKSQRPRCFGKRNLEDLPVVYRFNKTAWMTSLIFTEWLHNLDRYFNSRNRKILMFIDNCSSHPSSASNDLTNIRLIYFPPKMTTPAMRPRNHK